MLSQRGLLRLSQRVAQQGRVARVAQRRLYSTERPAWAADNAFNREREAVKQHAASTSELWRKLSIYVVIPALVLAGTNAYNLWNEHWEHWNHLPPLEERVEYPYQNIRTKNFPWGDGDKTAFWNDKVNYHNRDKTT
ncbi:hypothetical protein VTN31DRAFT_5276 [Thermomyces dupontii]|uniref:uncharacterized protein n=1 Tax=Talaromyces thermophilus TaxID=28565 RepID=UPI003743219F